MLMKFNAKRFVNTIIRMNDKKRERACYSRNFPLCDNRFVLDTFQRVLALATE